MIDLVTSRSCPRLLLLVLPFTLIVACCGLTTASALRNLAAARNIYVGAEYSPDEASYQPASGPSGTALMAREFNMINDSGLKWSIEPNPPTFVNHILVPSANPYDDFAFPTAKEVFAQQNGMKIHAHALLYYRADPLWLTGCSNTTQNPLTCNTPYTSDELRQIMKYHIQTALQFYKSHYPGLFVSWDVVNELAYTNAATGRHSVFEKIIDPATGTTSASYYVELGFQYAHEADPSVLLCLNENSFEDVDGARAEQVYSYVKALQAAKTPISCVGFQFHKSLSSYRGSASFPSQDGIRKSFARFADLGLKVFASEVDLGVPMITEGQSVTGASPPASATAPAYWGAQAQAYGDLTAACVSSSNCLGILFWDFNPLFSWLSIPGVNGTSEYGLPTGFSADGVIFTSDNQPKPAYTAVANALNTTPATTVDFHTILGNELDTSAPANQYHRDPPGSASNRLAMWTNSTASQSLTVSHSGRYQITLSAYGTLANGVGPHALLGIDGNTVGSFDVSAVLVPASYAAWTELQAGAHLLRITYDNDLNAGSNNDRNLIVDHLSAEYMPGNVFSFKAAALTISPPSAGAGEELSSNGMFQTDVQIPSAGTYDVQLTACSHQIRDAKGISAYASGALMVDSAVVGTFMADSDEWKEFTFSTTLSEGHHPLSVVYANDGSLTAGSFLADRHLMVEELRVTQRSSVTTPVTGGTSIAAASDVRVYPSLWRSSRDQSIPITFDHLRPDTVVKVFTISGRLIKSLHADLKGVAQWNPSTDPSASGIYIYLAEDMSGKNTHGKFVIMK